MCGIWGYISKQKKDYNNYFNKISHRGPDASILLNYYETMIGFHRLSIINKKVNGMQPFMDNNLILVCNGEIYNYKEINYKYNISNFSNDCVCILELYKKLSFDEFVQVINKEIIGEFAFLIFHYNNEGLVKVIAGRDIFGVRPLYYSKTKNNDSETKNNENYSFNEKYKITIEAKIGQLINIPYNGKFPSRIRILLDGKFEVPLSRINGYLYSYDGQNINILCGSDSIGSIFSNTGKFTDKLNGSYQISIYS